MGDHGITLEIFVAGAWRPAPALDGAGITARRGVKSSGDVLDIGQADATLDNTGGSWAPQSVLSPLYGLIGQNTPGRVTMDGDVRLTGEVSWRPERPLSAPPRTPIAAAGVLRRLGIGNDPLLSPLVRAAVASGPTEYWACDDGRNALEATNSVAGGAPLVPDTVAAPTFGGLDAKLVPAGLEQLPLLNGAQLSAIVRGTSAVSWRVEFDFCIEAGSLSSDDVRVIRWETGGGITRWEATLANSLGTDNMVIWGYSPFIVGTPFGATVFGSSDPTLIDGRVHTIVLDVEQVTSTNMAYKVYKDGVLIISSTNTTGVLIGQQQVGAPSYTSVNPDHDARLLSVGAVGFWSPHPASPIPAAAVDGYDGELAVDRFERLCAEEGVTSVIVGDPADSVAMGPQTLDPLLEQFELVARTDDASIYEPKDQLGLAMRTGASKLNQATALTVSYLNDLEPPLTPVYGDAGIRNDVTARNPDGTVRRVVQETGPRNVQAPADDPQGVGRYKSSLDVNTATGGALGDAAGWRVHNGVFEGTWYAAVVVDLDAAPGLATLVNAVEIGDVLEVSSLPVEDTLSVYEGVVIGIEDRSKGTKSRKVAFYLVPGEPYRVGVTCDDVGDTDALNGYMDADTAVVHAAAAAGAATFQVEFVPLWSTTADDYPQDFIVGAQRVTVTAMVSYLNANPYFETSAADWSGIQNAAVAQSTAAAHEGTGSLLVTPDGVSSGPGAQTTTRYPCVAGLTYSYAAWLRISSGGTGARVVGIAFYDASNTFLSTISSSQSPAATVWTFYSGTAVAPATATQMRLITQGAGVLAAANTWRIDEATLSDGVTQTLTVSTDPAAYRLAYPLRAGDRVRPYQPLVLTL